LSDTRPWRGDRAGAARALHRAGGTARSAATPLQARVRDELLERLQFFHLEPRAILELGCDLGAGAEQLRRRFPRARVLATDPVYLVAREARRRQRFWRRFECVCADPRALPLAAHSVDLVFSNLTLPWCDDPAAVFTQAQRALRPGGLMLYSTFGADTLQELRTAWKGADTASPLSPFADMTRLAAGMSHAGLSEPVMDREMRVAYYPDVRTLIGELRAMGAGRLAGDRRRSLTGRGRWQAMLDAYEASRTGSGLPASWEIIYGAGFAGSTRSDPAGTPGAAEFAVPVGAVRSRDRSR
jgi:malonyl-CoA O-methyltransferase